MAVGRFQVMATLQAARAFVLGLPLGSAKSWGLNRAIFYAAAKRGLLGHKHGPPGEVKLPAQPAAGEKAREIRATPEAYHLGDDYAYHVLLGGKPYFVIGDEVQSEERFSKQVENRFGAHFRKAWEEALRICKDAGEDTLRSRRGFYEVLYKPRRDELAAKWTEMAEGKGESASARTQEPRAGELPRRGSGHPVTKNSRSRST